jgi:predicted nucleic-acid-binding Zn-ribbon protein
MKEKPRMTLAEMAAKSAGCNGRLLCPKCGCADFRTYKTIQGQPSTFRYKQCRHCGHKLMTIQSPEQAIRDVAEEDEIEDDDSSVV